MTAADRKPSRPWRIFIIAGEHSGDALGARLMAALRDKLSGQVIFSGVGGHAMEQVGLASLFPLADIAVMGPFAILKRLPTLVSRVYETVAAALAADPDIVVIVDAPEFTHPIAKRIRKQRPDIAIVDYVSPTVWAWRPGRARKMAPYVDHVLALLPFEPDAHKRLGGPPCTYVGHPLLDRLPWLEALDAAPLADRLGLDRARPLVVVLPGSRRSEVERLMDVFGAALGLVSDSDGGLQIIIPAMPNVRALIDQKLEGWPRHLRPVVIDGADEVAKFSAFKLARAALAASGTVTLELALTRTPMVVAYRVDAVISALRHLIKAKSAVLANLITGEKAVPEFMQEDCTPDNLAQALDLLLDDGDCRRAQVAALARVPAILSLPSGVVASAAAADVVIAAMLRGHRPTGTPAL